MAALRICALLLLHAMSYVTSGERIFHWDRLVLPKLDNSWRATSFAVTTDHVYLSLVDVVKEEGANGVVVGFRVESTKSPKLEIFPDETVFKIMNPVGGKIMTPIAVRTDRCNRLWILDAGVTNLSGDRQTANPALHIVDLNNKLVTRTYPIPTDQFTIGSLLTNLAIENPASESQCERTFAYIADSNRPHLIVYDYQKNMSHSKEHHYFNADPAVRVRWDYFYNNPADYNGVYGMAVVREEAQPTRLFFHPLASTAEFSVTTQVLHDPDPKIPYKEPVLALRKQIDTESGVEIYDEASRTFFQAEINHTRVGCWSFDSFRPSKTSETAYVPLQSIAPQGFVQDLAVEDDELWALVRDGSQLAIHKDMIADMVRGTSCEIKTIKPRTDGHGGAAETVSLATVTTTSLLGLLLLYICH